MISIVKSYHFLSLYLSIELQSLSFYLLAGLRSQTEASAEASLKYFILSTFSSAIFLFGIALLYGATGTLTFNDLNLTIFQFSMNQNIDFNILSIAIGCVCISLLFKLGAVPFHN